MYYSDKFIRKSEKFSTFYDRVPAPMFRKIINISKDIDSASISITALSFYDLYINGKRITKGLIAPYSSALSEIIYYDEYDLTKLLHKGENVIGVIVGSGMQNDVGRWNWRFDRAKWRGAVSFASSTDINYKDGTSEKIECDETWKTDDSPIIFDSILMGEHYDARKEQENWLEKDFYDSLWKNAEIAPKPLGEPTACIAEPIKTRYIQKPYEILKEERGYIYKFKENAAGVLTLNIKNSNEGQKIELIHGEVILDGKLYDTNTICIDRGEHTYDEMHNMDVYICKGAETETYTPRFTFHGFQYVLVTGLEENQATLDLLAYNVMNTELTELTSFECSDECINHLQKMVLQSDYSNFYYFPMDCPHREKNGWTGDAALSCEQMVLNLSVDKSFKDWMKSIRYSQHIDGSISGYVPTPGWELSYKGLPAGPAWDKVITEIPYRLYQYRGDLEIIKENANMIGKYLNYIAGARNERGLMVRGFGDWVMSDLTAFQVNFSDVVSNTLAAIDICSKASLFFEVLNMPERKAFADLLYTNLKNSFRKHLVNKESLIVYGDNQSPQAMAIFYGIFEGEEKKKAVEKLVTYIHENNDFMHVGVLGGRVIFHVLAENGYEELAYKMITGKEPPSYGFFHKIGATTLWEGFVDESTFKPLPYSRNHHFWGDISSWFFKFLAGIKINPDGKDYKHVEISPCFIENLSYVKASEIHPKGKISVNWERDGDIVKLLIDTPTSLHGKIKAYKGYKFIGGESETTLKSGEYKLIKE